MRIEDLENTKLAVRMKKEATIELLDYGKQILR